VCCISNKTPALESSDRVLRLLTASPAARRQRKNRVGEGVYAANELPKANRLTQLHLCTPAKPGRLSFFETPMIDELVPGTPFPFEKIRRTASLNSVPHVDDHFVGITEMITACRTPTPSSLCNLRACPAIAVATAGVSWLIDSMSLTDELTKLAALRTNDYYYKYNNTRPDPIF
jgi:hypothetical protein